jgi:hypothetical protein
MVAENGGSLEQKNKAKAWESLADGSAHASLNLRYSLEAGKKYVFGAGFASNNQLTISPGFCEGVVTIVRT